MDHQTFKCGSREQFNAYISKTYRSIYRASLKLTKENINYALEAYLFGIVNSLGIVRATQEIYRRYGRPIPTRLANFIRELGLWRNGWVLAICVVTATIQYRNRKGWMEEWNLTIEVPHPFVVEVDKEAVFHVVMALVGASLNVIELSDVMAFEEHRIETESADDLYILKSVARGKVENSVVIRWELVWSRTKASSYQYHYSGSEKLRVDTLIREGVWVFTEVAP